MRIACGTLLIASVILFSCPALAELKHVGESFHFDDVPRIVKLKQKYIVSNTLSITADGTTLSDGDYLLDVPSGTIKLLIDLDVPVTLEVSYSHLSLDIPSCFFRRKLQLDAQRTQPASSPSDYIPPRQAGNEMQPSKLRIFGSKSIGLKAGTGADLDLNQTLNVQIEGYLRDNLKVTGVLSDESRPEVGGISTSLGEIDKITLRLSSENFTAGIGDIDFRRNFGSTARFRKTLKGGSAAVKIGEIKTDVIAGGIRSKHDRLKTLGRDGVSGPYRLLPNVGQASISVLPGTERVWLDGHELTRGVDADYQIDYVQGEVAFSPRIMMTSRSRIEVDFEYLDENYRQDFYAGSFGYGDSSATFRAEIDFISQADSKDNPSRFDLTDTDVAVLAGAGDSTLQAVRSGVTKVDSGDGDYIRDIVGPDTIYVYAGRDQGDYRVSFSYVGQGSGDYDYLGGGIYGFTTEGGGAYLPIVRLPMPQRSDALSLTTEVETGAASFRFNGMISDHDRNLFSSSDDNDDIGSDMTGEVRLSPFRACDEDDLGWQIELEGRRSESDFYLPGRIYRVEQDREWGLVSDSIFSLAEQFSVSQRFSIGRLAKIDTDWGTYRDRDYFNADRYGYAMRVEPRRSLFFDASRKDRISEDVRRGSGYRLYENKVQAGWSYSRLKLVAGWSDESDLRALDTNSTGRRLDRYGIDVDFAGLSSNISYEVQDISRNDWLRDYDSRDVTVAYSGGGGLRNSEVDFGCAYRRIHHFFPDRYDQSQLGATIDYRAGSYQSLFDLSLNYRVNRQGIDRTGESFIRLGEGEGDYRLEDGVYVPDPLGDYIRVVEVLDVADVGVIVSRGLKLRTNPAGWKSCPNGFSFLKKVVFETQIRTSEQGDASESFDIMWIVPYAGIFSDSRLSLERSLRQTAKIGLSNRLSLFLSFNEECRKQPRQTPTSAEYMIQFVERVEMKLSTRATYSIEHRFKRLDQDSRSFGDASFTEHQIANALKHRTDAGLELIFRPSYLSDMSREDDLGATMWEAAFEANQRLAGSGRVSAKFAFQNVTSSRSDRFIPFQYAGGRRVGDNLQWGVSTELRFGKNMSVRLSYDGEKIPLLKTRHVSSVSMRARF
jgi:hypothetical protein